MQALGVRSIVSLPPRRCLRPRWHRLARFAMVCGGLVAACAVGSALARADEQYRYAEGSYQQGELKYRGGLPVLTVAGNPSEMGDQFGKLTGPALRYLMSRQDDIAGSFGLKAALPVFYKSIGRLMAAQIPPDQRAELEAMAHAADVDVELLIA